MPPEAAPGHRPPRAPPRPSPQHHGAQRSACLARPQEGERARGDSRGGRRSLATTSVCAPSVPVAPHGPLPGPSRPLPPHAAGAGPALALTAPDSAPRGACRRWALLIPARGLAGRPGAERGWGLSETCPSEYLLSSVSRNYLEVLLWLISPSFFSFFHSHLFSFWNSMNLLD